MRFKGSIAALITPFRNGKVDEKTLKYLVNWHIESGTSAIAPCGTTGESPTLSFDEHKRVIRIVVEEAQKRVPVIAGTGSNSTREAIELTQFAKKAGADGALIVCPYYNKPTQEGLFRHFETIARAVPIPIVLYNIPGRTGISMAPETVARLAQIKTIVAIKEASGSLDQASSIRSLCDMDILSGDDSLTVPLMAIGGVGVISVLANIMPREVAAMTSACLQGDFETARQWHLKLFELCRTLFIETNPIPVKAAMRMLGLAGGEVRPPLTPLSEAHAKELKRVLQKYRLKVTS